ncbi:MAG: hypothetical protein KGZ88_16310 [Methylomicrobium sp.]|nr:hypothetical protein [Methylomicrobium sp.]
MKITKAIFVILGTLLLSGCGDQFWCGEDGCNANSSFSSTFESEKK